MNIDRIFETMNRHRVKYLSIGGMNVLLRHKPIVTLDVNRSIEDSAWGPTDEDGAPVANFPAAWLARQSVFCLNSASGIIDILRSGAGLDDWEESNSHAVDAVTAGGIQYRGISDRDWNIAELKASGAAKRDRNWDPLLRWQVFQQTIAWADQQHTPPRNSKQNCVQAQQRLVALLNGNASCSTSESSP